MSSDPSAAKVKEMLHDEINATLEDDGFILDSMTAKEAVDYINSLDSIPDLRDLADGEANRKARKTVLAAVGPRISEIVTKEEKEIEKVAAGSAADDSNLEAPNLSEASTEEAKASLVEEAQEYPLEPTWTGEQGRYIEIKHISRTMHPMGGLDERVTSPAKANQYIEKHFAMGFELIKVIPQGYGPDGVSILWVLGKLRDNQLPKHSEIWHIQRTLTDRPGLTDGGVSGFQADTYISSFFKDGWKLFTAEPLQKGGTEIPMLWVLVR